MGPISATPLSPKILATPNEPVANWALPPHPQRRRVGARGACRESRAIPVKDSMGQRTLPISSPRRRLFCSRALVGSDMSVGSCSKASALVWAVTTCQIVDATSNTLNKASLATEYVASATSTRCRPTCFEHPHWAFVTR